MKKKLHYLIGIVLLLSLMPVRGISQTPDDTKADKAERAHRKHVVRKAWHNTKTGVRTTYHKVVHAPANVVNKIKAHHQADEKSEGETK